jgi:hypothetical protein
VSTHREPHPPCWRAIQQAIPSGLNGQVGKVFYSGRLAFSVPRPLYVIGLNPGGCPEAMKQESILSHTNWVSISAPEDWSAYRDESWKGKQPGHHGMQPRLLHLFRSAGLEPGAVPSSNLIFIRSRRESDIASDFQRLAALCWPFHQSVIERLSPKVILCLGRRAGDFVRRQVGALEPYAEFTEANNRRWQSRAYRSATGLRVVLATHPSIADWTAKQSDPTGLVQSALRDT